VNQTRPHCVNQMGKTHSKPLAARHGRRTAWARHAMCESAFNVRDKCYEVTEWRKMRLTRRVAYYSVVVSRRRRCALHDITSQSRLSLHAPCSHFATASQTHMSFCVTGRPVPPPHEWGLISSEMLRILYWFIISGQPIGTHFKGQSVGLLDPWIWDR